MPRPRFPFALALALVAHAAVLAVAASHRAAAVATAAEDTLEVTEVSEAPPPVPTLPPLEPARANGAANDTRAGAPAVAFVVSGKKRGKTPQESQPAVIEVGPDAPVAESPRPAREGAPPVDLGLGNMWKRIATSSARADAASGSATGPSVDSILRDPLAAHDRQLGLGAAGPLVSVAHDAASPSLAPDVGAATLEVECDATGMAVAARVVLADSEPGAWGDVAKELVRLAATKRLQLPRGAHGLRARLRIVAERTLPSGEKRAASAGAMPDDDCDGTGINRRCAGGMPAGVSGTWGDLANIGAKRSRIVHVRLLDEEAL